MGWVALVPTPGSFMYKPLGCCGRFGDICFVWMPTALHECHFLCSCAPAQAVCSFVWSLEKTVHSQNCNSSLHPNVPHQWKISKFTKPNTQHTHPIHVWGLQQHQWGTDLITLCPLFLLSPHSLCECTICKWIKLDLFCIYRVVQQDWSDVLNWLCLLTA